MKKKTWLALLSITLGLCATSNQGLACTDFILKSQDQAYIVGRSLEFGRILPTQIQSFPKGEIIVSQTPDHQKGMAWTSQYAYMGMVFKPAKVILDGFNEKGLSIGYLWMPGTEYPALETNSSTTPLFFADMPAWLLGNFATVAEVKAALTKVNIYAGPIPGFSDIPPVHLVVHDNQGQTVVVEFLKGKMHVFDDPVGVLTNSPELPWHLTNLRNYINLSALNAKTASVDGTVLNPIGQGTGLLGIPGDWTPPSRFVRTAIFKQALAPIKDAPSAVLAAIHLLNTVDIPYGVIRETKDQDFDFTQWIVIKDLTNKKLYYRTYGNQNIEMIDLKEDLSSPKIVQLDTISPNRL